MCAKSDVGFKAISGATVQYVSEEERIVRFKYMCGEYPGMSEAVFNAKITKIRKSTGRP